MSNETDLDWLARNVHVWPKIGFFQGLDRPEGWRWVEVIELDSRAVALAKYEDGKYTSEITEQQWLDRRAELQNKPSWGDLPDWAIWISQDSDGSWWMYETEPKSILDMRGTSHWSCSDGCCESLLRFSGEVTGDYMDTLEKRPEKFKPSIEEANRLAQEFKPFASIEDNQEREMNQDNEWFERGELPPVGFECEMKRIDGRWCKAVTVGKDSGGRMVCELNDNGVFYASTSSAESFRPIRTEREELEILLRSTALSSFDDLDIIAGAIIAAGFRKEKK